MLGKRIRDVRVARGLTQQALADAIAVSRTAVTQWESGSSKGLKPGNLLNLCRVVGVRPEWLVFGEHPRDCAKGPRGGVTGLADIVAGVERALADKDLVLPPEKKGELVALLYRTFVERDELPDLDVIRKQLQRAA